MPRKGNRQKKKVKRERKNDIMGEKGEQIERWDIIIKETAKQAHFL